MDEQGSGRIAETLASLGEDLSAVDARTMHQLEKLEGAISAEVEEIGRQVPATPRLHRVG